VIKLPYEITHLKVLLYESHKIYLIFNHIRAHLMRTLSLGLLEKLINNLKE